MNNLPLNSEGIFNPTPDRKVISETCYGAPVDKTPRVLTYSQARFYLFGGIQVLVKPTTGSSFLASSERQLKQFARTSESEKLATFTYSLV